MSSFSQHVASQLRLRRLERPLKCQLSRLTPSNIRRTRAFANGSLPTQNQHLHHRIDATDIIETEEPELQFEDNGEYEIILPESEDAISSLSQRDPVRSVPSHIVHPPYATTKISQKLRNMAEGFTLGGSSSRTSLGGEEERKLRGAARLAHHTLAFAGSLVSVRIVCNKQVRCS